MDEDRKNLFNLPVEPGDLVFFSKLDSNSECSDFERAITQVAVDSIYHVAIIVGEESDDQRVGDVVHATVDAGVVREPIVEAIKRVDAQVVDVCRLQQVEADAKLAAVQFCLREIGTAYNDLFASNCLNSLGQRAFYCSQLITEAYAATGNANRFPDHDLNFVDRDGTILQYWVEYYQKRGLAVVPQGEKGSHPSKMRTASALVLLGSWRIAAQ